MLLVLTIVLLLMSLPAPEVSIVLLRSLEMQESSQVLIPHFPNSMGPPPRTDNTFIDSVGPPPHTEHTSLNSVDPLPRTGKTLSI